MAEEMIGNCPARTVRALERLISEMLRQMRAAGVDENDSDQVQRWVKQFLCEGKEWP